MSAARRKAVVVALAVAYAVLLVFGRRLFGTSAAVITMIGAFVVGFAWLWLLVAPWAVAGRVRRPPHRP